MRRGPRRPSCGRTRLPSYSARSSDVLSSSCLRGRPPLGLSCVCELPSVSRGLGSRGLPQVCELPAVCACPSLGPLGRQQSAGSRQACASCPWHLSVWGTLLLSAVASRPFPGVTSAAVLLQASLDFTQELGACRLRPAGPGEAGLPAGRVTLRDQGRRVLREVLMGTRGTLCTRRRDGGCATARPRPARVPTMGRHATAPCTSTAMWLCSGHPFHLPVTVTFSPDSRQRSHEQGPDADGPWGPGVWRPVP